MLKQCVEKTMYYKWEGEKEENDIFKITLFKDMHIGSCTSQNSKGDYITLYHEDHCPKCGNKMLNHSFFQLIDSETGHTLCVGDYIVFSSTFEGGTRSFSPKEFEKKYKKI